jgi:hypothetical protein
MTRWGVFRADLSANRKDTSRAEDGREFMEAC